MSTISLSAWPMPELSTMMRSKPADWQMAMDWTMCCDSARWAWRVASERMKTRSEPRELSRIRSPRRAPPVRRLVGSTEMMAMVISGSSARKRRTSSSVSDDLPAPPVPVVPRTGEGLRGGRVPTSKPSSARVTARATASQRSAVVPTGPVMSVSPGLKSEASIIEAIIPSRPMVRPSSGEKILVTP